MQVEPNKLTEKFNVSYGKKPKLYPAPGRVKHIGGHTDCNDGFGGCTISLIDPTSLADAREHIVRGYREFSGKEPWHYVVKSASPAGAA